MFTEDFYRLFGCYNPNRCNCNCRCNQPYIIGQQGPRGPQGPAGRYTIAQFNSIGGTITANTAIPLTVAFNNFTNNNAALNPTGSITLQPGTYSVEYYAEITGTTDQVSTALYLNGAPIPLTTRTDTPATATDNVEAYAKTIITITTPSTIEIRNLTASAVTVNQLSLFITQI